jgi:hypothetical protein
MTESAINRAKTRLDIAAARSVMESTSLPLAQFPSKGQQRPETLDVFMAVVESKSLVCVGDSQPLRGFSTLGIARTALLLIGTQARGVQQQGDQILAYDAVKQ